MDRRIEKGSPEALADLLAVGQQAGDLSSPQAMPTAEGRVAWLRILGYELLRKINQGGQAVVYQATQGSTGRLVAVKVMRDGSLTGAQERARFQRQAQLLSELHHPGIVPLLECGSTPEGWCYVVMPYVRGRRLDDHLLELRQAGADAQSADVRAEAFRLFLELAEAVDAAHQRGIIHRDLKPSNIMVDEKGRVRVLDFGLSRVVESSVPPGGAGYVHTVTATGQFVGSLPWASPEQAEGRPSAIDARSDVYALGVLLYWLPTDAFPYEVLGRSRRC